MLIYSTTLNLQSDIELLLEVITNWLSRKSRENITVSQIKSTPTIYTGIGHRIQTIISPLSNYPIMGAIKLIHGDSEISGRQWTTEAGFRKEGAAGEIEFSILLRTDEISTKVDTKIQTTVPYLVHDTIKRCSPVPGTPGLTTTSLDDENEVEAFAYSINYPQRRYPFVLISPTNDNKYLVNVDRLRFLLEGLADIIIIPMGADTYHMGEILGKNYIVWNGGINIIYPEIHLPGKKFVPVRKFTPDELQELINNQLPPENEILTTVTHRTNLPNSWKHISSEKITEHLKRRELDRLRTEAQETGKSNEYIVFLEEYVKAQDQQLLEGQQKINDLQVEIGSLEGTNSEIDDEKRQLRYEIENLKAQLSRTTPNMSGMTDDFFPRVKECFELVAQSLTTPQSLSVIAKLFPHHIKVLDSAWKSAEKSESFKERRRIFELLWKLSTDYWSDLASGKGDAEARTIFGNSYAAKESETVESNKRARQLRTFCYNDREIVMMKHLKIGVKDSQAETIRVHFEWEANEQKILIGYCGPHLDHR
jgi:hypothetical protein